jgi:hypothetical protein
MDLLMNALRINVKNDDRTPKYPLPNYMLSRYSVKNAYFDKQRVFLLYPKTELDQVSTIKKHIQKLQSFDKIPVVLMLTQIAARQREGLISGGIPFIVENKQCYLPFMGTVLTQRCDAETESVEKLLPSAQMLLFYFIYSCRKEMYSNMAVEALGVSAMTMTRAVRQLEQIGLIQTHKTGVMKVITTEYGRKELFEKAQPYLVSPVKKVTYLPKEMVNDALLLAGDSALAKRTMLNPPRVTCFAAENMDEWKHHIQNTLVDENEQVALQIWKYNPRGLSNDGCVDTLSLAMCYVDDGDERVEEAVEEMMNDFWRNTNG